MQIQQKVSDLGVFKEKKEISINPIMPGEEQVSFTQMCNKFVDFIAHKSLYLIMQDQKRMSWDKQSLTDIR